MAVYAQVSKWGEFQHYKNRVPPWIKLHRSWLDDFDFQCLPLASKALAPCIWLLASESTEGVVRVDIAYLAFRLRMPEHEVKDGLKPLIERNFLEPLEGDANSLLAACLQDACPETEGETEAEGESLGQTGQVPNLVGKTAGAA